MASKSSIKRPIHRRVRLDTFSLDPDAFSALVSRDRQDEPIVFAYFERGARGQASWSLPAYDGGQSVLFGKLSQHLRSTIECSFTKMPTRLVKIRSICLG
jgi:hypothetical protein